MGRSGCSGVQSSARALPSLAKQARSQAVWLPDPDPAGSGHTHPVIQTRSRILKRRNTNTHTCTQTHTPPNQGVCTCVCMCVCSSRCCRHGSHTVNANEQATETTSIWPPSPPHGDRKMCEPQMCRRYATTPPEINVLADVRAVSGVGRRYHLGGEACERKNHPAASDDNPPPSIVVCVCVCARVSCHRYDCHEQHSAHSARADTHEWSPHQYIHQFIATLITGQFAVQTTPHSQLHHRVCIPTNTPTHTRGGE